MRAEGNKSEIHTQDTHRQQDEEEKEKEKTGGRGKVGKGDVSSLAVQESADLLPARENERTRDGKESDAGRERTSLSLTHILAVSFLSL